MVGPSRWRVDPCRLVRQVNPFGGSKRYRGLRPLSVTAVTRPLPACPAGEAVERALSRRTPSPAAPGGRGREAEAMRARLRLVGNAFTGRTSRPGSDLR